MEKLTGPRVCAYSYPRYFKQEQRRIADLSLRFGCQQLRNTRRSERGLTYHFIKIVVGSDFHSEIYEAAREGLKEIYGGSKAHQLKAYESFGFHRYWAPPFFLGALFELLPRKEAVELFAREYLPPTGYRNEDGMRKAGHILLRFSCPESAADFAVELLQISRGTTDRMLKTLAFMSADKRVYGYQFRRFEPSDLFELAQSRIPLIDTLPDDPSAQLSLPF